jgi:hypothetical protein
MIASVQEVPLTQFQSTSSSGVALELGVRPLAGGSGTDVLTLEPLDAGVAVVVGIARAVVLVVVGIARTVAGVTAPWLDAHADNDRPTNATTETLKIRLTCATLAPNFDQTR